MAGSALKVEPPALPVASVQYQQDAQNKYSNVLRIFFNRLTSSYNALIDLKNLLEQLGGGGELNFPNGGFYDTTTQTAAAINTPYAVQLNSVTSSNFITVIGGSQITLQILAAQWLGVIYNLQYSLQFTNTTNGQKDVNVWIRKNGVDVPDSNSKYTVHARKSAGIYGYLIAAVNIFVDLQLGDYVEVMWSTESTGVYIEYLPAGVAPATPSAIVTMTYVSVHD